MRRSNGGFTLVELLVTLMCCSLVTLAAMSLSLLGLRMETRTEDTVGRQQTARIVLSMLEDLAGEGQISRVETVDEDWALLGAGEAVLLQYGNGMLTTGAGAVLMDGLEAAGAELEGNLLTFTVTTEDGTYSSSVYCRTAVTETEPVNVKIDENTNKFSDQPTENNINGGLEKQSDTERQARYEFLMLLATQYGSRGEIKGVPGEEHYYSQWYCDSVAWTYWPGWSEDTPWCACFLSWALAQRNVSLGGVVPKFSEVNAGIEKFKASAADGSNWHDRGGYDPIPGDLIFFDWELDGRANHVGAVLYVADGTVYTIEGNSGSGVVALHRYAVSDPRIMGYGVLDWPTGGGEQGA